MKRPVIFRLLLLISLASLSAETTFAQQPGQIQKPANPFSFLTIIKLNEVSAKEDMDKVKEALRAFGYKVHSHKINFERKQVLVRMRQEIPNDSLVQAFKNAGYTAWFDPKETVQPADAAYRGNAK